MSLSNFKEIQRYNDDNNNNNHDEGDDDSTRFDEQMLNYINQYILNTIRNNRYCAGSFESFFSNQYERQPWSSPSEEKEEGPESHKRTRGSLSLPFKRRTQREQHNKGFFISNKFYDGCGGGGSDRHHDGNKKQISEYKKLLDDYFLHGSGGGGGYEETENDNFGLLKRKSVYSMCDEYVRKNIKTAHCHYLFYKNTGTEGDNDGDGDVEEGIDSDGHDGEYVDEIEDDYTIAGDDTGEEDYEKSQFYLLCDDVDNFEHDVTTTTTTRMKTSKEIKEPNFVSKVTCQEMANDAKDPSSSLLRSKEAFSNFKSEKILTGVNMCIAFDEELGTSCVNQVGKCSKHYCWKHYRKMVF